MGYAVLHIDKARGNDSAMSAHIERTFVPNNVDASRTHLNRDLVQFPANVTNRTEAIAYRIATAGIYRKVAEDGAAGGQGAEALRDVCGERGGEEGDRGQVCKIKVKDAR